MPVRHYVRLTVRPVLSVLVAWSFAVAGDLSASDRTSKEPTSPKVAKPDADDEPEAVVRTTPQPEQEGVVWLRNLPHLSQLFGWSHSGSSEGRPKSDESPIRSRMLPRLQATSVPVMVAPLDSCTPVDVGRIEDLLFADPATADRIIRAAGQGFRVVVLTPVADPNPSPDSQDCPRPIGHGSSGAVAGDGTFPEPTPVHQDPEGRVQMRAVPRPIARNQHNRSGDAAIAGLRIQSSAFDMSQDLSDRPGIVITSRAGHAQTPRPARSVPGLLVPPAPEFDVNTEFPIAFSPEPPRALTELSPADHLRIAANKLAKQGLTDEAKQLRTQARDLDSQIDKQLAAIRAQQEQLAAEAARLTALRDTQRQIQLSAQIVEVNRKRMMSPEGVALVRRHLQDKFDENAQFSSQVTSAAVVPEFIREAGQKGFLNVLSRPQIITTPGREATIEIGSQFVLPVPGGTPQTRKFGIHLTLIPHLDEGGQLRLEAAPEVSRVDHSNSVTVAGHVVPGLQVRRRWSEVKLSFGQTAAMGGFHSPTPHLETREIEQAAGEVVDPHARNYEILFLVTPMAPAEATSENPAGR